MEEAQGAERAEARHGDQQRGERERRPGRILDDSLAAKGILQ